MDAGSYLFAGLTGLGNRLKEQSDADKERARKFKSLVDYADASGIIPKDRAITMDADALEGAVKGTIFKREQQRQQEEQNVKLNQLVFQNQLHATQVNRQAQADAAATALLGNPAFNDPVTAPDQRLNAALFNTPNAGLVNPALLHWLTQNERKAKGITFMKSPTGADIALSPDTGAFQYDPFSKVAAEHSLLAPRDALKTYNENQTRISEILQKLKQSKDPEFGKFFDPEALNQELADVQEQQNVLRPQFKSAQSAPTTGGNGKLITDKAGRKWLYTGNAADPTTDRDPSHWKAQ